MTISLQSGLYDGFSEWRTPTSDDYRKAITDGLVVCDTNILLDMYRLAPEMRDHVFKVLGCVDTLWVPHQVLSEFWTNRDIARRHLRSSSDQLLESLGKTLGQIDQLFREWANRAGLSDEEVEQLTDDRAAGFALTETRVREIAEFEGTEQGHDTNEDDVLARLETLLAGRVGAPLDGEAHVAALAEGKRRRAERIPPGYKDNSTTSPSGDYIVWLQTIKEASDRAVPYVLLVTGDVKEDWMEIVSGQRRGPRRELQRELDTANPGSRLLMSKLQAFVDLGEQVFGIDKPHLPNGTSASAIPVEEPPAVVSAPAAESGVADPEAGAELWSPDALKELLARLDVSHPSRASVIRRAVENGGSISRDEVYRLLKRDPSRTLRAFTRPVNRITQDLRDEGLLNLDAPDPLWAVYDPSYSYVQAARFEVLDSFDVG